MGKKRGRKSWVITTAIVAAVLGVPGVTLAIPLDFLTANKGLIASVLNIDSGSVDSVLNLVASGKSLFRTGNTGNDTANLIAQGLGALGVPNSELSRFGSPNSDYRTVFNSDDSEKYFDSANIQKYIHSILGEDGQTIQSQELGQSEAYKTASSRATEAAGQLTEQSTQDATEVEEAAKKVYDLGKEAAGARSSQRILKLLASQMAETAQQNQFASDQNAGLSSGLTNLSLELATLNGQQDIANRQRQRMVIGTAKTIEATQHVSAELHQLRQAQNATDRRNEGAATQGTRSIRITNLEESFK